MSRKTALREYGLPIAASLAAVLLGMLAGCLLWTRLPEEVAVHFNFHGQADSFAPKAFAVFGLPLIMLGFQLVCISCTLQMPTSPKLLPLTVLWIVPLISVCVSALLYVHALGGRPDMGLWMQLCIGAVLILLGNAFPKSAALMRLPGRLANLPLAQKQKLARFNGYCLVGGGLVAWLCAPLGCASMFFAAVVLAAVLPAFYAFSLQVP